jgi:hypothetical protein
MRRRPRDVGLGSNSALRVFPLHVRLGAASGIPSGTARFLSRAISGCEQSQQGSGCGHSPVLCFGRSDGV